MDKIQSQPGPQTTFLSTSADLAFFGGSAGGGKTFSLLLEPLRHIHRPQFRAVIFRRTTPEIKNAGGIWEESMGLYPLLGAIPSAHKLRWTFPSGAAVSFAHMEHEDDCLNYHGAQIPMIGFDEVCSFTEKQFFYMLSRNRSATGIRPYIRATCNPDADSFVAKLIEWYIDWNTGYAIKERSGVIRWFGRSGDDIVWADSPEALIEKYGDIAPKSFTFIRSKLEDNQILMAKDPSYLANLKALSRIDRERLLEGNWKIRPAAGMYFKRTEFEIVDAIPAGGRSCRYWDRAGTKKKQGNKPDWTAGVKVTKVNGFFYVEDVRRMQEDPHTVEQAMLNTAKQDGQAVTVAYMQDPGSAGVYEAQATARALAGFIVKYATATGDKETRAKPASSQAGAGNIKILRAPWNDSFLTELENFPEGANDDQVDGFTGAFNELNEARPFMFAV